MKNIYLKVLGAVLLTVTVTCHAQVTFQKVYPATVHESGKDVLQTPDGGFIIAASTETSITNDLDILVVRTNSLGDTLWRKSFGGDLPECPNSILQTSDGNYFIVGYTQSAGSGDFDHYLLKINAVTGDSIFSRVYGGYGYEESKEIIQTSDGNYVIVGASNSISFSDNNGQLIKIDPAGNVIWSKYYGGPLYESLRSVKQCADNGFIITGKSIDAAGAESVYLVRTNSIGDTLWTKLYTEATSLEGKSVVVNSDGSYTLSVDDSSTTSDSDVRIMRFDPSGNFSWSKTYGGTDKDISKMIQLTSDGGYIVSALSRSFGWVDPDFWILKLNSSGDTLWTRHYGGSDHEHCYAVRPTSDGGYVAVGHSRSFNPGRIEEIMLVKMNSIGTLAPLSVPENDIAPAFSLYPNPAGGKVMLSFSEMKGSVKCRIMNSIGQVVYENMLDTRDNQPIVLEGQAPGVYYVTLSDGDKLITKKLVLD
ncbi:MAG: T9SS type A sorting domain-containing protein [Bacteroidia bacterium]